MADHDMVKRFNALVNIIDHLDQTSKPAQQLSSEDLCLILTCLTHLSRMKFPTVINSSSPFPF